MKMTKRMVQLLLALMVMLQVTACNNPRGPAYKLNHTLNEYQSMVRWSYFSELYAFHGLADGNIPAMPAGVEGVKVTDYQERRQSQPDEYHFSQEVAISYTRPSEATIRTTIQRQSWEYRPEQEAWFITTPPPVFR